MLHEFFLNAELVLQSMLPTGELKGARESSLCVALAPSKSSSFYVTLNEKSFPYLYHLCQDGKKLCNLSLKLYDKKSHLNVWFAPLIRENRFVGFAWDFFLCLWTIFHWIWRIFEMNHIGCVSWIDQGHSCVKHQWIKRVMHSPNGTWSKCAHYANISCKKRVTRFLFSTTVRHVTCTIFLLHPCSIDVSIENEITIYHYQIDAALRDSKSFS